MTYPTAPHAGYAYGGTREIPAVPGGGVIADPSNPDAGGFRWSRLSGGAPWAGSAWSTGGITDRPNTGGMLATPDPDSALVRLTAWWSGSPYLRITRLLEGQTAPTPVRGAYPKIVRTPTRRNACTNPSGEVSTAGWVQGANTTVTNPADAGAPAGANVIRLAAAAAGSVNTTIPCAVPTDMAAPISFALRLSAAPSGALTITGTWTVPGLLGSTSTVNTTLTMSAATLAGYVGSFARTPVLSMDPPVGAVQGALQLSIAGLPAGATADIDAVLIGDSGDYFDGDMLLGAWSGPVGLSASTLAGTQVIEDREAPLDVPLRYVMTAPDQPGFQVITEPVVLQSRRRLWLSHPLTGQVLEVLVKREPKQTYKIEQELLRVIGRKRPVPVTAAQRADAEGTLEIATARFDDRDQLKQMLDDGAPLLLRMPADHGHGPGEWMSFADVDIEVKGHRAQSGTRHFTLPYAVVDPPALPPVAA